MTVFTGYNPELEPREELFASCLDYDVMDLVVQGDLPDTRNIMDKMRRDDQYNMNSCAGFGMTNAGEVCYYLASGKWRQFNPLWTYRHGQAKSGIRGDNGATITGVVRSSEEEGLLPEDIDNDGKTEYPYVRNYNFRFPAECAQIASNWKIGYKINLRGFDQILRFLQAGQGAVVTGGSWGNWKPDSRGICRQFRGGGGGHARAYVDWITIDGEVMLVEPNSHFKSFGYNGFSFHTKSFVDQQAQDRWTVTIGVSDLSSPEPRVISQGEVFWV